MALLCLLNGGGDISPLDAERFNSFAITNLEWTDPDDSNLFAMITRVALLAIMNKSHRCAIHDF